MKRARAKQSNSAAPLQTTSDILLEGSRLDLKAIIKMIVQDALREVLEKDQDGKKCVAQYVLLPDPTMEQDADPHVNEKTVFLHPTQFRLLCSTDFRVLKYRAQEKSNSDYDEVLLKVPIHEGVCECDCIDLHSFVIQSDGSAKMELRLDDFAFDAACFFGKDCCEKGKKADLTWQKWTGEDGYCQGQWCEKNHNRWTDRFERKLLHCKIHDGPMPKEKVKCGAEHRQPATKWEYSY